MSGILILQVIFTYIGGNVLRTTALTLEEWIIVFAFSMLIVPVDITRKLIMKMG